MKIQQLQQKLRKYKILATLASLKITVVCLLLLFVLTFWGTVAQVQHGLYLAQERYFHSFFFLILGFIPFPGAQLVMWVMFVNLASVTLVRFVYTRAHTGIFIIHAGLLLFLVSAYITLHASQESHLTLNEGEAANVSSAFNTWEVAIWEPKEDERGLTRRRDITAVDLRRLVVGEPLRFEEQNLTLQLNKYWRNAAAYTAAGRQGGVVNASGIARLEAVPLEKEPEKNVPGAIFTILTDDQRRFDLLLYGAERQPTPVTAGGKTHNVILRLKRYPLPFTLKLLDFMMERHPGTDTPRSFKSKVAIETNGVWREKLISMNNPLRYKNFTFYQSSYSIDRAGREASTLAVVKNSGRLLPYTATGVTFSGLVVHFVMMAFRPRARGKP